MRLSPAADTIGLVILRHPIDCGDRGDGTERGKRRENRGEGIRRNAHVALGLGGGFSRCLLH
jgi:hypothetical protein